MSDTKTPRVHHIGIIFSGTADFVDTAARVDAGKARALSGQWTNRDHFDHVYIVMDIKNPWPNNKHISVLSPTVEAMRRMVDEIKKTSSKKGVTNVDIQHWGHGEVGSAAGVVDILNDLPAAMQRIWQFSQCRAASVMQAPGLLDDNDLVMVMTGLSDPPAWEQKRRTEQQRHQPHYDLNWADGRDLGVLHAKDMNGDGLSHAEIFWWGVAQTYNPNLGILPLTRGAIFASGPAFVDYGFGQTPIPRPFPTVVTDIPPTVTGPDPLGAIKEIQSGYLQGITVVGYDLAPDASVATKAKLDQLAKQYDGWVHFVWIQSATANDMIVRGEQGTSAPTAPFFSFSFPGAIQDRRFTLDEMALELDRLSRGYAMEFDPKK